MADDITEPVDTAMTAEDIESKGFMGSVYDPTPNDAYTVAGVTGGTATVEGGATNPVSASSPKAK